MNASAGAKIKKHSKTAWNKFFALPRWAQIASIIGVVVVIIAIIVIARGGHSADTALAAPSVTVERVDALGGNSNGVDVLGTVQSISEADILSQSGGTVTSVHTTLGATVPAGFVIASLDSAAASAAVLQAQGGYDAAVAAAKATTLQAQNTSESLPQAQATVRNMYESDYTTVTADINNDAYQLFGDNTPVGPALLINPLTTGDTLPRELRSINDTVLTNWEASVATDYSADPQTLLTSAQTSLTTVASFLSDLEDLAGTQGSGATTAQLAAISTAQASVNALLANISVTTNTYNAAKTAAAVSATQTANSNGNGVTSAQAGIEEALGSLRSAQAAYEKTVIRAPIGGTINFLPIHVGDYVTQTEHVATVARNNALEIVMELSQGDANRLAVGDTVTIEGSNSETYKGIVTTLAPALNPETKEIEVHVAVNDGSDLVNGQSVQVLLPTIATDAAPTAVASSTASSTSSTIQLPLTAIKLLPNERDVFTVDATGHIVAHPVQIGTVVGDRIQITTPLAADLEIVTDVRGISAGDAVTVSTSTPQ